MALPLNQLRAAALLELRRRDAETLCDFIPRINPKYERPDHLAPLVDVLERSLHEPVFALCSVPPQHGKTETILAGLAYRLRKRPHELNGYVSFAADVAHGKSKACRAYAKRGGVSLSEDFTSAHDWRTPQGGGLVATGVGGPLTSYGLPGLLVVDDPHKNRAEAESLLIREQIYGWFSSTAMTRGHPTTSVLVVHTRWHEDDLIGRLGALVDETGKPVFERINLQAIQKSGEALWPKGRPLSFLNRRRLTTTDYDWWSMYMGSPRPRGGEVFKGVYYYDALPKRFSIAKGVDLAYTASTRADHSVSVVMLYAAGYFYVVDVRRKQCEVPTFVPEMRAADVLYPGPWIWYCASSEKGSAQLMPAAGTTIKAVPADTDKFVRAQPVAAMWNQGKILLPRKGAPWMKDFLAVVSKFTGVGDRYDDDVDALAGAYHDFIGGPTTIIEPSVRVSGYRIQGRGFG